MTNDNEAINRKPMSDVQIKNMRNVMLGIVGPVALIMPDSDIVAFRDQLQKRANALPIDAACIDEKEK